MSQSEYHQMPWNAGIHLVPGGFTGSLRYRQTCQPSSSSWRLRVSSMPRACSHSLKRGSKFCSVFGAALLSAGLAPGSRLEWLASRQRATRHSVSRASDAMLRRVPRGGSGGGGGGGDGGGELMFHDMSCLTKGQIRAWHRTHRKTYASLSCKPMRQFS